MNQEVCVKGVGQFNVTVGIVFGDGKRVSDWIMNFADLGFCPRDKLLNSLAFNLLFIDCKGLGSSFATLVVF